LRWRFSFWGAEHRRRGAVERDCYETRRTVHSAASADEKPIHHSLHEYKSTRNLNRSIPKDVIDRFCDDAGRTVKYQHVTDTALHQRAAKGE
jgi:hypothetical protein